MRIFTSLCGYAHKLAQAIISVHKPMQLIQAGCNQGHVCCTLFCSYLYGALARFASSRLACGSSGNLRLACIWVHLCMRAQTYGTLCSPLQAYIGMCASLRKQASATTRRYELVQVGRKGLCVARIWVHICMAQSLASLPCASPVGAARARVLLAFGIIIAWRTRSLRALALRTTFCTCSHAPVAIAHTHAPQSPATTFCNRSHAPSAIAHTNLPSIIFISMGSNNNQ